MPIAPRQDQFRSVSSWLLESRHFPSLSSACCHTFGATGISGYLENCGTIEDAQAITTHESPRTTKPYDRASDEITLYEVERIAI